LPKVFLDYGHGGNDPGAICDGYLEKDFNLKIGKRIKYHLERHNFVVVESREGDTNPTLRERSNKANANKVDISVSIHVNAYTDSNAQGFETFHHLGSNRGKQLATCVQKSVIAAKLYTKNRGLKTNSLHMTREVIAPAILVEMGFITNKADRDIIINKSEEMAIAITKGILSYYETDYIKEKEQTTGDKIYRVQVGAYKVKANAEKLANELKSKGYSTYITVN
jgi:N-acetylmuramoyl-L-alanine amidase